MTKLAVHIHLYYLSQLPRVLTYLQNLTAANIKADIFITLPTADKKQAPAPEYAKAVQSIKANFPQTVIIPTANLGYDIGPFFAFLHHIDLNRYTHILKIHTKNRSRNRFVSLNHHQINNALWCDILQESLIGSPQQLQKCLHLLQTNPDAGMVAPSLCITADKKHYATQLAEMNKYLTEMNLPSQHTVSFVAGTMFLARASLFKPLLRYDIKEFAPTDATVRDFTTAHVFERLFSAVITAQGYQIVGTPTPIKYKLLCALPAIQRFLFQKKHTQSGKLIIKICKIPVFSKPLNY